MLPCPPPPGREFCPKWKNNYEGMASGGTPSFLPLTFPSNLNQSPSSFHIEAPLKKKT